MTNPCKDCEERQLGCHSTCERYTRFWQQNRQANRKRRQETKLNTYVAEAVIRVKGGRNGSWEAYRKVEEK